VPIVWFKGSEVKKLNGFVFKSHDLRLGAWGVEHGVKGLSNSEFFYPLPLAPCPMLYA